MSLESRWRDHLETLRRQGRYRELTLPCGVDFSSNDYLGYGKRCRPRQTEASTSGTASRLLRGHHEIWDDVETRLARWHGAEAALMFSSGYAANEGLLSTVIEPGDWVASDALNHASIIDGLRLAKGDRFVYRHNDLDQLEAGLRSARAKQNSGRQLFLVTESLYSMEGDFVAPGIAELVTRYGAQWIIDEAHATGCLGKTGAGLVEAAGWRDKVLASVHTGGKALGTCGAYVCCSRLCRELLINRCRQFIFTTALPPEVALWWLEMIPRAQADESSRRTLTDNAAFFHQSLQRRGVKTTTGSYIVSIELGKDAVALAAAQQIQKEGFDIRAIRPPTVPAGTARLRVSIHADHDRATLEAAADAIGRAFEER